MGFDADSVAHIQTFKVNQPFLFHIGDDPYDIEVFNFVTGVKYEEAEPHKYPSNIQKTYQFISSASMTSS